MPRPRCAARLCCVIVPSIALFCSVPLLPFGAACVEEGLSASLGHGLRETQGLRAVFFIVAMRRALGAAPCARWVRLKSHFAASGSRAGWTVNCAVAAVPPDVATGRPLALRFETGWNDSLAVNTEDGLDATVQESAEDAEALVDFTPGTEGSAAALTASVAVPQMVDVVVGRSGEEGSHVDAPVDVRLAGKFEGDCLISLAGSEAPSSVVADKLRGESIHVAVGAGTGRTPVWGGGGEAPPAPPPGALIVTSLVETNDSTLSGSRVYAKKLLGNKVGVVAAVPEGTIDDAGGADDSDAAGGAGVPRVGPLGSIVVGSAYVKELTAIARGAVEMPPPGAAAAAAAPSPADAWGALARVRADAGSLPLARNPNFYGGPLPTRRKSPSSRGAPLSPSARARLAPGAPRELDPSIQPTAALGRVAAGGALDDGSAKPNSVSVGTLHGTGRLAAPFGSITVAAVTGALHAAAGVAATPRGGVAVTDACDAAVHFDSVRGASSVLAVGDILVTLLAPVTATLDIRAARGVVIKPGLTGHFKQVATPRTPRTPSEAEPLLVLHDAAAAASAASADTPASALEWDVRGTLVVTTPAPEMKLPGDEDEDEVDTNKSSTSSSSGVEQPTRGSSGSGKIRATGAPVSGFYFGSTPATAEAEGWAYAAAPTVQGQDAAASITLTSLEGVVTVEVVSWWELAKRRAAAAAGGSVQPRQ